MDDTTLIGSISTLVTAIAGAIAYKFKKRSPRAEPEEEARPPSRGRAPTGELFALIQQHYDLLAQHAAEDVEVLQRLAGSQEGFTAAAQANGALIDGFREETRESLKELRHDLRELHVSLAKIEAKVEALK